MERLQSLLTLLLIVVVLGLAVVVSRADARAQDADATLICINRAQALATIALLAPASRVDEAGRVQAMETLGRRLDDC